jgi:hypothetical protein
MEVVAELAPRVPVHGAFCFWLPINRKLDFVTVPDSGLPMFSIWTINGYPLWHRRQMVRQLNTAGTLAPKHADDLAARLAERFAAALRSAETVAQPKSIPPPCTHTTTRPAAPASTAASSITGRSTSVDRSATTSSSGNLAGAAPGWVSPEEYKARKQAEQLVVWEAARGEVEARIGCSVPAVLADRLRYDSSIYCHHALWHSRVYLACAHGRVGQRVDYATAASVVGAHHPGRTGPPQWRALTAFLEHLRDHGYIDFDGAVGSHVKSINVLADLSTPPPIQPAL